MEIIVERSAHTIQMLQSIKEIGDRFAFKLNLDWNPARLETHPHFTHRCEKKEKSLNWRFPPTEEKNRKGKIIINFQQFYGILIKLRVDESSKRLIA